MIITFAGRLFQVGGSTHMSTHESNTETAREDVKQKFSCCDVMWTLSLGFYQPQIYKNPHSHSSDDVIKLQLHYLREKKKLDTAVSEFISIFIFA